MIFRDPYSKYDNNTVELNNKSLIRTYSSHNSIVDVTFIC
jgi:hypothetical protein